MVNHSFSGNSSLDTCRLTFPCVVDVWMTKGSPPGVQLKDEEGFIHSAWTFLGQLARWPFASLKSVETDRGGDET
jgi:hypothetical protein